MKRGKIVGATWRCVLQVLGQRALRWSLLGDYGTLVKHTATTLIADDAILERAIKQGLPLLSQKMGPVPFFSTWRSDE